MSGWAFQPRGDRQRTITKKISLNLAEGRGLRKDDAELLNTLRKCVGAFIFKLKQDVVVREGEGTGDLKQEVLARL